MAFALRQLKIDSVPDLADAIQVTLHMTWFNYTPFSVDFGYSTDLARKVEIHQLFLEVHTRTLGDLGTSRSPLLSPTFPPRRILVVLCFVSGPEETVCCGLMAGTSGWLFCLY